MKTTILNSFILSVIAFFGIAAIGYAQTTSTFNTPGPGSITIPCGVTSITVEAWGGGGAGAGTTSNNQNGRGGGGGGGYVTTVIAVTAGQVIPYTVGAGAAGAFANGAAGGNTTFGTVTANGGAGGTGLTGGAGGGGAGGTVTNGVNGQNSVSNNTGGNGGAGANGGAGGAGGVGFGAAGGAGMAPGGGGGGGGGTSGGANNVRGGNGGNGRIRLTYTVDPSVSCPELSTSIDVSYTVTCGSTMTWYDSGGSGGNYNNNENYFVTFCPDNEDFAINVNFTSFQTQGGAGVCNDFLRVFQDQNLAPEVDNIVCQNNDGLSIFSTSPDGCITFQFVSDGSTTQAGWEASISCIPGCINPAAAILDASALNICGPSSDTPGNTTVLFDASPSTPGSGDWELATYEWDFGNGNTQTRIANAFNPNNTITETFEPGVYVVNLVVRDNNTAIIPAGCPSTNAASKIIRVLPEPNFDESTQSTQSVSCNDCLELTAQPISQTYLEPLPVVEGAPVFIPDGNLGTPHESRINLSGIFPEGATIEDASCLPESICFSLEHSFAGDLTIELIAPSGETVRMLHRQGGGALFGDCVASGSNDGIPGCPRDYCFVDGGGTAFPGTLQARLTTNGQCDYTGVCENGSYIRTDNYNSLNPFTSLIGADLNGVWTLRFVDNLLSDDGYLFGWNLTFPGTCYAGLQFVTPDLVTVEWLESTSDFAPGITATQTTTSEVISDPGADPCPGDVVCEGTRLSNTIQLCNFPIAELADNSDVMNFSYDYRVTDEYGCNYTRTVLIDYSCMLLPVELKSLIGIKKERINQLKWVTSTESNNDFFTVEYSVDGQNWSFLGKISGAGNSATENSYSYDHHAFQRENINYYRLSQTDYDGTHEYLGVVSIDNRENVELIRLVNLLGQEVTKDYKGAVIEYYSDGSIIKRIQH